VAGGVSDRMACLYPVHGFRAPGGQITQARTKGWIDRPTVRACGNCLQCGLEYARQWALRGVHEAQMHPQYSSAGQPRGGSCFVTLTFDDDHLPPFGALSKDEPVRFMKRLRHETGPFRYLLAGEYADPSPERPDLPMGRPHYHMLLFGTDFRGDRVRVEDGRHGDNQFVSETIAAKWQHKGRHRLGDVTTQSAGYVARYTIKKQRGEFAEPHYSRLARRESTIVEEFPPEFSLSSKGGGGLGKTWFDKYWRDIYPHDFLVHEGVRQRPPRYYDTLLERRDRDMFLTVKAARVKAGENPAVIADNYPDRRTVKEKLLVSRASKWRRDVESQ